MLRSFISGYSRQLYFCLPVVVMIGGAGDVLVHQENAHDEDCADHVEPEYQ